MTFTKKKLLSDVAIGVFSLGLTLGVSFTASAQNQQENNAAPAPPLPGYPSDQNAPPPPAQANSQANTAPTPPLPDQPPPPPGQAGPPPNPQGAPPPPPAGNGFPNIRSPYNSQYNRQAAPPSQPPPATLTIPGSEIITVRPTQWISSDRNHMGDAFYATLDQPIVANGWVVARRGQTVIGRVTSIKKSGHFGKQSQLGLELTMLNLVDGQQATIQTQGIKSIGGSTSGTDVATVGATTGVGAVIGAAADRDHGGGAGIGAGVGAVAGIAAVLVSPGRPTVVSPETLLSFEVATPITVDTSRSQYAFHPVTQSDYRNDQNSYGNGRYSGYGNGYSNGGGYAAPPPAPYVYYPYDPFWGSPYYGWGYYPAPVIGLGFEWGGGWGYRGGWRGGFRR